MRPPTGSIGAPPVLPRTYLDRSHLRRALDAAAAATVTEVVGPAGSGKTLGVAGWVERRRAESARSAGPVEPPTRWCTVTPGLTVEGLRALLAPAPGPGADDDPAQRAAVRVVLDNAERLTTACVTELERVLDVSPAGLHVVLITRWDLPVRRLAPMLLGTMSVVRGDVVRLTDEEVRSLVALHAPSCPAGVVDAIVDQTRGWAAAVVLAARAARRLRDRPSGAAALRTAGSDLVGQEAFASLGPRERHVLLAVGHEETVTASSAVHLSQDPGAAEVVEGLEQTGLLVQREPAITAPGAAEDVFRVHPILLQVVRRRFAAGGPEVDRARAAVAHAARADLARGEIGAGLRRTYDGAGPELAVAALARHGLTAVLRDEGRAVGTLVRLAAGAMEAEPGAWVAAAVDRWFAGDVEGAARWSGRLVAAHTPGLTGTTTGTTGTTAGTARRAAAADVAIAHLLRAQLGAEDVAAACDAAAGHRSPGGVDDAPRHGLLSHLRGAARSWTGELAGAESDLAGAVLASRTHAFRVLLRDSLQALALTELLRGRPLAAAEVAAEAQRSDVAHGTLALAVSDAAAARLDPWRHASGPATVPPPAGHALVASYLAHVTAAQRLAVRGRADEAASVLSLPPPLPALPRHLAVDLRVRRALVAVACDDHDTLSEVEAELEAWDAEPERALVQGISAICRSDLAPAATHLRRAAATARSAVVAVTATVTAAQVAAARGDRRTARRLVTEAVVRAEHRRDAVPFLGWVGRLVPVHVLLAEAAPGRATSSWADGLTRAARAHGSVAERARARTVTAPASGVRGAARPALTLREVEVLTELSRGATYGDIAGTLVVSSNTVKTHVTSLYAKLGATRRSEALAAARALDLI